MRLAIRRCHETVAVPTLTEVVTPRANRATLTAAENFLATLSSSRPFSLEIAATVHSRRFLVRTTHPDTERQVARQLAAAYPQADLRPLDVAAQPDLDPAVMGVGEQVAICALTLEAPDYLPLRTFHDSDLDADGAGQADPVLGLLSALADLPDGWRALSQVVLSTAPPHWSRPYQRLAMEPPLPQKATPAPSASASAANDLPLLILLVAGMALWQVYQSYQAGERLFLVLLVVGVAAAVALLGWWLRRRASRPVYDPRLVQDKISRVAYQAQLRLAVFAPQAVPAAAVQAQLARLAAAYRQYSLPAGNGIVPRPLKAARLDLTNLAFPKHAALLLNARELAGLWHLPQAQADTPLVERTTALRRLPLPASVADGCRIGVSEHQGTAIPVHLSHALLRRHLLLVAKTRRGKSSLLLQLARYLMTTPIVDDRPSALVLIDPHRDLARAALALVPPERRDAVVHLDVSDLRRPFGLNLIDTGLGWDRDQAVHNTLLIFRREFETAWGPRMEDAFRAALATLYAANETLCRVDPLGRRRQYTILDAPYLFLGRAARDQALALVHDPHLHRWWHSYFEPLEPRFQLEIVNPVQTKVHRFLGSTAARRIVGQSASTIDPRAWLRERAIVIVNTARGEMGEDLAGLLGSTLLNLLGLSIGAQASLQPEARHPVSILVDEFHVMPGADYEAILSELAKYGANLVLSTQSLARLETLGQDVERELRAILFANVDGVFAFQTSAEDAQYLVHELGEEVGEADLVNLADFHCYAKVSAHGERLPTFSLRLDSPPTGDVQWAETLAAESALRYGTPSRTVEDGLARQVRRGAGQRRTDAATSPDTATEQGVALDVAAPSDQQRKRNNNRPRREPRNGRETGHDGRAPNGSAGDGDRASDGPHGPNGVAG